MITGARAALGIVIVGIAIWNLKKAAPLEPRRVIRLDHVLPEDQEIVIPAMRFGHTLAVSPDGNQFVYSTSKGLFLRSADELNAVLIPGTAENPQSPFFSPDGQWIGYWSQADNKLKKISIRGGAPVALCSVYWVYGAIWYPDNNIIFSDVIGGVRRVSANGGTPELLVKGTTAAPQLLPDGKSLLFTDVSKQPYRIVVQSLKSGELKELFAGMAARYLATGHLVYGLQNNMNLFAVAFDARKLEVKGGPVPIVEGVDRIMAAFSDSGTLVYLPGTAAASASGYTLVWVDGEGKEESLGAPPNQYLFPKISPDGTRVALTILGENYDIWIWDLARKTMTRLTFDKASDIQPIWTPDSKRILLFTGREGRFGGIFWKQADGTGEEQKLVALPDRQLYPYALSNDGKTLVVLETENPFTKGDIGMLSMEGEHARKPLLNNPDYMEVQPKLSPDGKWMAYVSGEFGKSEVYVRPFPDVNKGRWQVSTKGGVSPLWAPNGREPFYFGEDDGSVTAVAVETGQAFSAATPRKLFSRAPYLGGGAIPGTPWDIHPDGKRFLMIKQLGAAPTAAGALRKINIVLNWVEELKQRVPVK
jgi:Tol biopolymer transport system component